MTTEFQKFGAMPLQSPLTQISLQARIQGVSVSRSGKAMIPCWATSAEVRKALKKTISAGAR